MKACAWKVGMGFFVLLSLMAVPAMAQQAGGGGGQRGNFDPAAMRQRRMDQIKEQLAPTDDEWAAIQPKLDKVMTLQFQQMAGRFGGGWRGRNGGGNGGGGPDATSQPAGTQPVNPVVEAQHDLQTALNNKESTPDDIKTKLAALRDAKTKAKDEYTKAQADLRDILTVRQEAVLVTQGILD